MKSNLFKLTCLLCALAAWWFYWDDLSNSPILAIALACAAGILGIVFEKLLHKKNIARDPEGDHKTKAITVYEYISTFLAILVVFYSFYVFSNNEFGYYMYGGGKYGYEIGLWDMTDILTDFVYSVSFTILPLIIAVFAIFRKPIAFGAAGILGWLNVLNINTAKVFGSYTIIAAAGNASGRETTVYNYANTVVAVTAVLVIALFALAVLDLIVKRPKKLGAIILLVCMLAGLAGGFFGYRAQVEASTYDIEERIQDIYSDTKKGSEEFRAENFSNAYGTATTVCAMNGCDRTIVATGDSNCCAAHSNLCGNCGKYIDGDAMFCMDCIEDALD